MQLNCQDFDRCQVTIVFQAFAIENDPNGCNWDALSVDFGDGIGNTGRTCGNQPPQPTLTGTAPVTLSFVSDGGVQQNGFLISYEIELSDPCIDEPCENGAACEQSEENDDGFICICSAFWQGALCGDDVDECENEENCVNGVCENSVGHGFMIKTYLSF